MASFSSATFTPDRLIASEDEILSRKVTILSGQNLVRGAVLGKVTASGKYVLSLSGSSDGSEVPDAILATDTGASGGDKEAGSTRRSSRGWSSRPGTKRRLS